MSLLSLILAVVLVLAAAVLVVGLARRIWLYAVTPAPLRIPTTPAPLTRRGAALRVGREVMLFESLFKADKLLWLASVLFHLGLLLVLLRHLRYFVTPAPAALVLIQPFGKLGGLAMVAGLLALLARRLLLPRVRYVTRATDIAMLILLLAIGASGLSMTFLFHTDIMGVKQFFAGIGHLSPAPLPEDPPLVVHLLLVAALMAASPFSKLLHMAGIFFSPTRNQCDDARERRHVAPWARPLDERRQ